MKGRRPIPTALKLVNGNPGKRPLNENEPQPAKRVPPCPSILTGDARKAWRQESRRLAKLGLMTEIDGKLFAGFCTSWGNYCRATREIEKLGSEMVSVDANGLLRINPWLGAQERALKQLRSFGVEFGISPSSRSRIDTKAAQLADDDDGLLG